MHRLSSFALCVLVTTILFPTSRSSAQSPHLFWTQQPTGADGDACIATAIDALQAGTMYNVTTGTKSESDMRFATGANSNLTAVIACSSNARSVATLMVAGAANHFEDATALGEYLSRYLAGERDGNVELSSSEAPVKMHEWLSDEWCLGCEGSETEKRYSGEILEPARSIRLRIRSGRAESGSSSVEVLVYDPNGKLVLTEQSNHDDWAEWRVGVVNWGRYEVVLRSLNRNAETVEPNRGELQVLVR